MTAMLSTILSAQQRETTVTFHNFPWGTSIDAFKARMGNPVHTDVVNGFQSLIYENISVSGFRAFMVAYFSTNGLEGGTYYFDTNSLDELANCYEALQKELIATLGPTPPPPAGLYEELLRERRTYETSWKLPSGYVYLKVNTRTNEPVTLWISFPTLTKMLNGS